MYKEDTQGKQGRTHFFRCKLALLFFLVVLILHPQLLENTSELYFAPIQLRRPMLRGGSFVSSFGHDRLFEPQIKLGLESTHGHQTSQKV